MAGAQDDWDSLLVVYQLQKAFDDLSEQELAKHLSPNISVKEWLHQLQEACTAKIEAIVQEESRSSPIDEPCITITADEQAAHRPDQSTLVANAAAGLASSTDAAELGRPAKLAKQDHFNPVWRSYVNMGVTLKEEVRPLAEQIQRMAGEAPPLEFVVVDLPSGRGKTQLAFALSEFEGLRVKHFVFQGQKDQPIYEEIAKRSGLIGLGAALQKDLQQHSRGLQTDDINDSQAFQSLGIIAKAFALAGSDAPCSCATVQRAIAEQHSAYCLFIDETPNSEQLVKITEVIFLRQLLRVAGILPILAGTSAKAANFVNTLASRKEQPVRKWCFLVTRLPGMQGQPPSNLKCKEVAKMLEAAWPEGNPLLISLAQKIAQQCSDFGAWLSQFCNAVQQRKSLFTTVDGALAEVNLLLDGSSSGRTADAAIQSHFAMRVCPESSHFVSSRPHGNVALGCFGTWLHQEPLGDPRRTVLLTEKGLAWSKSMFAPFEKDPFPYLVGLSTSGRFGTATTLSVVNLAWQLDRPTINVQNPKAVSNTGDLLECIGLVAAQNASAKLFMDKTRQKSVSEWLLLFLDELHVLPAQGAWTSTVLKIPCFKRFQDRKLAKLMVLRGTGKNVQSISRLGNRAQSDVWAPGLFVLEAKDRAFMGPSLLASILDRFNKFKECLGIILCRKLANLSQENLSHLQCQFKMEVVVVRGPPGNRIEAAMQKDKPRGVLVVELGERYKGEAFVG